MYTTSKKYLSTTLVLVLLTSFYFTLTAFAQEEEVEVEASTSVSAESDLTPRPERPNERQALEERVELRQENRAEVQTTRTEERAERVEVRQEVRSERREALKDAQQKRILNLSANISNRMEAAIGRIEIIIERFNQVIAVAPCVTAHPVVLTEAFRVGVAGEVKPVLAPAFAVAG